MVVNVFQDIPMRVHGGGTWLEAGLYEVERLIADKHLIIVKQSDVHRVLTIVRPEEIMV